ncbi:hypothetical protein SETIT_2G261400v2 [Setaria italica]|uniref:Uncharacterized protein n=1 Tax=Setaria italica TaxID=4555 RepID=A0A368Q343_SETIT|nr:uncharacterized protein LOC101755892 [Setaria italica]RCV12339.1 hypothetical protein SETIT_2G261400v2 [Setaria italica]RCV12340.1 hypothetical protein SETIT_2G261400v2 [Setaria italica]
MELEFKAPDHNMWKKEAAACDKDNGNGKDEPITVRNEYPRLPTTYFEFNKEFNLKKAEEIMSERHISMAQSIANDIIIPDPTPERVCETFFHKYYQLEPILKKDSVQCFLQLFKNCAGKGMSWNLTITAQTLTHMVSFNALQCAKVVLEGKALELHGMHANPNCINSYGYFPLHEAAERFSIDMIELLLCHGASANVRTVGNDVIEDLLPLHVAVENTCLHKYLEDNLSLSQNPLEYIYKLVLLLCLPEMKIFLDTTRLLAEKTNNLLEELWNYIEDGKLIQSAVLLLAAQEQIRGGCSSKMDGKKDGFDILNRRILRLYLALRWGKGSNEMTHELLEERRTLIHCAGLLVDVISHVGEPLSSYIQAHSEVPRMEVLEHVSSILKDYAFRPSPTEEVMDTINLRPYDCKMSDRESCSKGLTDANRAVTETASLDAAEEKAAGKEVGDGWDPTYRRRSFLPCWRVYPAYARADARPGHDLEHRVSRCSPFVNGSTSTPNHNS